MNEPLARGTGEAVRFSQADRSFVSFLKRLTDPLAIQMSLFGTWAVYGEDFSRPFAILAILTFSLTYPGNIPFRYRQIGLFGEIIASWGLVVAVLSFLGWAIKADTMLNLQPLFAWAVATPLLIYLLHLLSPYIAPRLFRFQNVASAVVVGANEVGLRIARSLNDDPLTGTKVEAFFDEIGRAHV